jgi:hypothetical protein
MISTKKAVQSLSSDRRVGRLTVLGDAFSTGRYKYNQTKRKWHFVCQCDCGVVCAVLASSISSGNTKSCGCLGEQSRLRHGFSRRGCKDPLYYVWSNIRSRCYDKNNKDYRYYGAKGIGLCPEWKTNFASFREFCITHGWRQGLRIHREDSSKDYGPSNFGGFLTPSEHSKCHGRKTNK